LGEPVNGDRVSFSHVSYPEGGGRDALFILESPFWLGMGTLRYGLPERMKPPSSTRSADSAERKSGGFFESNLIRGWSSRGLRRVRFLLPSMRYSVCERSERRMRLLGC
jgi:hypothetical protein